MRLRFTVLFVFISLQTLKSQELDLAVKSNLLNLFANGPSFSIEKLIARKYGLELSYAEGELNFRKYRKYEGFLFRAKVYGLGIETNKVNSFYGLYVGNSAKEIRQTGYVHPTGFGFSSEAKDFTASSYVVVYILDYCFSQKEARLYWK